MKPYIHAEYSNVGESINGIFTRDAFESSGESNLRYEIFEI